MEKNSILDNEVILKQIFNAKGFKIIKKISTGGYGQIFLAKGNDRLFAVKVQCSEDQLKNDQIRNECFFSKSFNGKNIVTTYAIYDDRIKCKSKTTNVYSIVMEKALYQDLKFFLKYLLIGNLMKISNFNENFAWLYHISPLTITFFIFQIIDGLKILYDCNYIHRDIKPENLLVAYQFRVKLCDFGIVSKAKSDFQLGNGTWCYEGPEYYKDKDKRRVGDFNDSFKIDYYPIGLILYYIFFRDNVIKRDLRNTMYENKDKEQLEDLLQNAQHKILDYQLNQNENISTFDKGNKKDKICFIDKEIGNLAIQLINENIKERPNIIELLDNQTLNQYSNELKIINDINQFLEIKLFIEFQKSKFKHKNERIKRIKFKY